MKASMLMFLTALTLLTASGTAAAGDDEGVSRRDVSFASHGTKLVGHLYLPAGTTPGTRLPAVVVTGAWTTVKEQMPATYARALAARGFAALTFDFRGWGGSEGSPRFLEHPERKTQDIIAAAAYLATRPEVDAGRVGGLGVCASAGYMSDAARRSDDIRALALVAPWLHDRPIAEAVYGGLDGVTKLITLGRSAAAADAPVVIEAASTTNKNALMFQAPYYTEKDRGLIDAYDNKFNVASWEPWLTYDGIRAADTLRKPTLAVHSKAAVIPQGITEFARRMGEYARIEWLDGVSQFDFYDQKEPVTRAANAVAQHLKAAFATQQDRAAIKTVVEGVGVLVDLGQFAALERLYADEVRVDYSALSGQPASTMRSKDLLRQWAALVPGFDRARHVVSDTHVTVEGSSAVATTKVKASHFIGAAFWEVRGSYRYELRKHDGRWRITSHTLTVDGESGTREVLAAAMEAAAKKPHPYLGSRETSGR